MNRPLLVLALIAIAVSGCMEKNLSETDTSRAEKSVEDLKALSVKSADNLTSFSQKSSLIQTVKFNEAGINATLENVTTIMESVETDAYVNLSGSLANVKRSTKSVIELPGKAANTSTTELDMYQAGNSTYVKDQNGKWTHILDPMSSEEIWVQDSSNKVKALAEIFNNSQAEVVGSENIGGIDTYKLKITNESADYDNLYNTAFGIAAQLAQYPMFVPSVNHTELNKTGVIEKLVWISKDTYLPIKYQGSMSFKITPIIIGGMDSKTGQLMRFNQSFVIGDVSIDLETTDLYYDFNKSIEIKPPEEALKAAPISIANVQSAP